MTFHGRVTSTVLHPLSFRLQSAGLQLPMWTTCSSCPEIGVNAVQEWQASWKARHQHPSAVAPRLFTVGRLDVASTGLIFVTNDGEKR